MAEQTSGDIEIKATPEEVLAVITDYAKYPKWAGGVKKATVKKKDSQGRPTEVSMEVSQMGINASYTLKQKYKANSGGLSWTSSEASGAVKDVKGEYALKAIDDETTKVTFKTSIELAVKLPGLIKKQGEKSIVTTALKGLKKEVEKG
jgi:ribosome-associated toxin RatA of RatAB toxin-antitoxin module